MINRGDSPHGSAMLMVLIILAILALMLAGLNAVIMLNLRRVNNYSDYLKARTVAYLALLDAESQVLSFDYNSSIESPPDGGAGSGYSLTDSYSSRRYFGVINKSGGSYNIVTNGLICNSSGSVITKGWCYNPLSGDPNYSSDQSFMPWTSVEEVNDQRPCKSYTALKNGNTDIIPYLDKNSANLNAHEYNIGDSSLCVNPRYYMELINLSFVGRRINDDSAKMTWRNGAIINTLDHTTGLPTSRIYRITIRAFGSNGNTRVTLQEYLMVEEYNAATLRVSGDVATNFPYRILVLSRRWL